MGADGQLAGFYWRLGWRYAFGGVLLLVVFFVVPFAGAWEVLSSVSVAWLGGALLLLTVSRWLGALRTSTLSALHDLRLSTARLFEISCVSTLYGIALPGTLSGGIVRWYRIGAPQRNHSAATALVVFERLFEYTALVLLGLIGWLLDPTLEPTPALAWTLAAIAAALVALCALTLSRLPARAARRLAALPLRHELAERVRSATTRTLDALSLYRDHTTSLTTFAISVGVHLVATTALYLMAHALEIDLSYFTALWLRACTMVVTAAPLTPAGLGVREISTVLLLATVGVDTASALALSMLQLVALLFFALLGGLLEARRYLWRGRQGPVTGEGSAS